MSDMDIEQVRATARKLAERVKTDPSFKARIQQDPVKTLTDEGLPEQVVSSFLHETGLGGDVAGYGADISVCLVATFTTISI